MEVYYSADGEDISWTFDARGNRLSEMKYEGGSSTGNLTLSYYDNSDLIKTRGTWQFNYDKNGNMLSRGTAGTWNGNSWAWAADKGELWEYEYDLSNRLINVKKSAAGTDGLKAIASYAYDIRGLRVESVKDSGVTYYQYGLNGELLWSDDGSTQEKYVYANSTIWAEVRTTDGESAAYYHHTDHLGTTETITDASGTVVWDASYEAYGKLVHENGTVSFKASFTGKQVDADTGLYYFNARWYDAELGRFVTEDPARDGSNWYEYCGNRPLVSVDPDGQIEIVSEASGGRRFTVRRTADGQTRVVETYANSSAKELQGRDPTEPRNYIEKDLANAILGDGNALERLPDGGLVSGRAIENSAHALVDPDYAREYDQQLQGAAASFLAGGGRTGAAPGRGPAPGAGATAGELGESVVPNPGITIPGRGVPNPGGRLGSPATRQQIDDIATGMESRGWKITGGGNRLPEEYLPGPGGARRGSSFPDITATKDGQTLRVNTIDTLRDGVTPTSREARNATRIRAQTGEHLLLIPK